MTADRLDSRVWLLWGGAAIIPLLVARNPFVVLVVLISVLAVRTVWASRSRQGWQWVVRIAAVFMAVGTVFNALTVHAGDQVLFMFPASLPLIGGRITVNAIAYGVVSGLAILTLVLAGTTVAAGLVWADLMRSMPQRVAPIAVAGSVAWSFLPGASQAFQEIRESQAARGHHIRGLRDLPPLVVPLLGGGLERAMTMSEALESRGFGHSGAAPAPPPLFRWMLVGATGSGLLMAYAFAVGQMQTGIVGVMLAAGCVFLATRMHPSHGRRTTRYRALTWRHADRVVAVCSLLALVSFLFRYGSAPQAAVFNPYPTLSWPVTDVWMLLGLALLTAPALIVPATQEGV